jgi:hypothetical protein
VRHTEVGAAALDVVRVCDEPHSGAVILAHFCSTVIEGHAASGRAWTRETGAK